jgi:hypothetical protein
LPNCVWFTFAGLSVVSARLAPVRARSLCCVRTLACAPASDPPPLPLDPDEPAAPEDVPELEDPLDPEEPVDPVEPVDPEELPEPDEPVGVEASPTVSPPVPEPEEPQAAKRAFPSVQATAIDAIETVRMQSSSEVARRALPASRKARDRHIGSAKMRPRRGFCSDANRPEFPS